MNNDARMSIRLPKDLKAMAEVVAVYEMRKPGEVVRLALDHYFRTQGYYSPGFAEEFTNRRDATP